MKNKKLVFSAILILLPSFGLPAASRAQVSAPAAALAMPQVPPIIAAIQAAKAKLENVSLNHALTPVYKSVKNKSTGKTSKTISGYNLSAKDIALAIADPAGNITITKGMLTGSKASFRDPAVDVAMTKFNGVNSRFQVNRPAGGAVVALKYLISAADSGSQKAIEAGLSTVLYVPYSDQLNSPDVIAYGQNYLDGVIAQAALQLRNLPSASIPGQALTEAIPPAMLKSLVYAEHTDSSAIAAGNVQDALDQLNIIFATNQGDAYKYSVSGDGYASRGIAQFIQSTYASLVSRHPEAGLNPDYVAGMADHVNSLKAMYLLLDDYAGDVRARSGGNFLPSRVFEYGAASYNAGATRVAKAVSQFGDSWNQDRSQQISAQQNQAATLAQQAKTLQSKIKTAKDKQTKSSLQNQLAAVQGQLSQTQDAVASLQAASLKNETLNYLKKVYAVVQFFNTQTAG
ncbi:MAG TPA: hypothetical protein VHA30_03520 [Patescibacteria group bacterium]|nr:hypothetical protein [Patescibacteria group bacterium]